MLCILLLLLAALSAQAFDWASVASLSLPTGQVASVSIDGTDVWTAGYVTDGLIAWYDGVWNVASNVHDSASTTWNNLVGNDHHWTLNTAKSSWQDNALVCSQGTSSSQATAGASTSQFSGLGQIEVCHRFDSTSWSQYGEAVLWWGGNTANGGPCLNMVGTAGAIYFTQNGGRVLTSSSPTGNRTVSVSIGTGSSSTAGWSCYINGASRSVSRTSSAFSLSNGTALLNGRTTNNNRSFNGLIYSVRIYNRALTPAEVARNWLADRLRFGI